MTKFVMLGSCRFEPYEILIVPKKLTNTSHTTEEGYLQACEKFHPAMDEADVIIVYAPDGVGEHTQRDVNYAWSKGKAVFRLVPLEKSVMVGFSRRFKRPISAIVMELVYQMLGWDVVTVYVINPFGESYIGLECRRSER